MITNVLSLFDGMSCGQQALHELGITYDKYYASEIDKYAITIAQKNFPNTIQIGDVRTIKGKDLPKIDLLMGGSPCQGFSFAGKQLNFDDPRSALFFEFVRVMKETMPKYFLLENVRMKKEYQDVITAHMGVEPIMINSALVSAQNRVRLYWTNIPNIEQPTDKGLVLKDVLDLGVDELPVKNTERNRRHLRLPNQKSLTCTATMYKGAGNNGMTLTPLQVAMATDINGHDMIKRVYSGEGKSPALTTMQGGNTQPKVACGAFRGRYYNENGKKTDHKESVANKTTQHLEVRNDGKTNSLTTVQKDNVVTSLVQRPRGFSKGVTRSMEEKSTTITPSSWQNNNHIVRDLHYRKLTPLECERLQTLPDNYTEGVSNTQRYKMIGNGWTVNIIKHILEKII